METNLAVLIDFENIAAGTEKEGLGRFDVQALMERIKDKGRILVARSYADWGRFARFKQSLLSNNVTMMELTSHGMQDKNRADIAMVVDCLELAFTKDYVDTFVVVSGDSDFTPLVLKMRELNKRVIGCGTRSSTSRLLIQACDEFIFYDSIVKPKRRRTRDTNAQGSQTMDRAGAFELLVEALQGLQRENPDPALASVVKSVMLRKQPAFNESEIGFHSFARFLEAARTSGLVRVTRDTKSGGYRVDGIDSDDAPRPVVADAPSFWLDPLLPDGTQSWVGTLAKAGLNPLSASTRKSILDAMEASITQRVAKKRRINVKFVQEDVRRALRKTHPDLPGKAIREVFDAVIRTGILIHRDGSPVRTTTAAFTLDKTPDEVNMALVDVYLDALQQNETVEPDSIALLAELFHGDRDRRKKIEETLAWMQSDENTEEPNDLDLDALLTFESEPEPETETESPTEPSTMEGAVEPQTEADGERPKRKRTRRRRRREDETDEASDAAESEDEAEPEAETEQDAPAEGGSGDDLDALLTFG